MAKKERCLYVKIEPVDIEKGIARVTNSRCPECHKKARVKRTRRRGRYLYVQTVIIDKKMSEFKNRNRRVTKSY